MAVTTPQSDELWTLGNLITKARKDAGLSQDELAALIKRARKTISRWETGPWEPRMRDLRLIAAATSAPWLVSNLSDLLSQKREWFTATTDDLVSAAA